jgi:2-polyprenyl-3-methyl-5-hydroxy-6-metoxy-1,4-benzoquinol methylase
LDDNKIERLTKCPLCKSGLFLNALKIRDHAVSNETFIVCQCTNCKVRFTNPRPNISSIDHYYDFPEYYSHNDSAKSLTQLIYQTVRKIAIRKKITLINSLVSEKGTLLDYGCGTGEFIYRAKTNGWDVSGIEPSSKARELAAAKVGENVFFNLDHLSRNQLFNVITLFHVLEHVHQLRKTVKKLVKHLKPNGYLMIAIPNPESFDANKYGEDWAGWDVPRHLYHFNRKAMQTFEEVFDLKLVEIKKMPFDSYYVSLVSETYRKPGNMGIKKYWNAIVSGLLSNKSAKGKSGEYSSNIYLFKKK